MNHRAASIITAACLLFYTLCSCAIAGTTLNAIKRPNLIFIYTDDQRFDALGASPNDHIRTPNLDLLCAQGIRFTQAGVVMSLCSPSRAAALTGRYGSANGVTGLDQPLRPGEQTFGQLLKQAGYATAFVELYDAQNDPDESKNLADDASFTAVRQQLAATIEKHIEEHLIQKEETPLERVLSGEHKRQFSGVYPHLASFNGQGECGTGAVVPWAGKIWWVTYSPHKPRGSNDLLYAVNDALDLFTWPGSVGGTPANRMIHRESEQLLIGPYVIDKSGKIRVISPSVMKGRLTGNARHLTDPASKVYYATMEEGFYEVDMTTLAVTELFPDANGMGDGGGQLLPGYHGKGLYSGQGRLVYANNGEKGRLALTRPDIESGALAQWSGSGDWQVVRRNQFTEVTGPGGIFGNPNPASDPVWSIGWDHRSLILMLLDGGQWHSFRLPKASHCYDGAHGWNTEWPRIRDIGQEHLLMTMHGMFWRFPKTFRLGRTGGIAPRSTYLKVIGDFCRWNDRIVFGCDDSARNEFLNTRKAKGKVAGPAQSQSNLWFVDPTRLDQLGPAIGRGAVWIDDLVKAQTPSDAFLFAGFAQRSVHLAHKANKPVAFRFEVDRLGDGSWHVLEEVAVPASGYKWHAFSADQAGQWVRVQVDSDCRATAWFEYREQDRRKTAPRLGTSETPNPFAGLARADQAQRIGGLLRAGEQEKGLHILATRIENGKSDPTGYYHLKPDLSLVRVESLRAEKQMAKDVAIPRSVLRLDGHSVLYVSDSGQRFRLPIGNPTYLERPERMDLQRTSREVVTERDLFQCAGTFYELPARNAGGFGKIRPIAAHPYLIQDYCSWRGLMVLSGISPNMEAGDAHIIRSPDGKCAVWLGAVDDLWSLGKPTGRGGPWTNSPVKAGEPSDPYLMAGFDKKKVTISHNAGGPVEYRLEIDISGTGIWHCFKTIRVAKSQAREFRFPEAFAAYWIRLVANTDCTSTVEFVYD